MTENDFARRLRVIHELRREIRRRCRDLSRLTRELAVARRTAGPCRARELAGAQDDLDAARTALAEASRQLDERQWAMAAGRISVAGEVTAR
jgi:hypothetical protein